MPEAGVSEPWVGVVVEIAGMGDLHGILSLVRNVL
jgi:hypothetical protein